MASLGFAVGLVAACDSTPQERAAAACTAICGCTLPPLPLQQQECTTECIQDFAIQISEECTACITAHVNSCSTLEADCEPICDIEEPPPVDFIDADVFFPDAF